MKLSARTYRLGARAVSMEQTNERILRAAVELFWESPGTDVRLESVAERADVSVQTVLRHFGSKDALFTGAVAWQTARVRDSRDPSAVTDAASAARQLVAHYEEVGDGVMRLLSEEGRLAAVGAMLEQGRDFHRQWCATAFASTLEGLPNAHRGRRLAQLVAVCDVYTWFLLRRQSRLSRKATELAMTELIAPLLKES
jgi:AcrR family transcriptional regulator